MRFLATIELETAAFFQWVVVKPFESLNSKEDKQSQLIIEVVVTIRNCVSSSHSDFPAHQCSVCRAKLASSLETVLSSRCCVGIRPIVPLTLHYRSGTFGFCQWVYVCFVDGNAYDCGHVPYLVNMRPFPTFLIDWLLLVCIKTLE